MATKLFYSMGEVSEMFDVNPSLLRHWETQFGMLRPKRNRKGNRIYSPQDLELLKRIYHLVKERGMTLDGAKRALRGRQDAESGARDMELLERLQRVRSLLEEVREELKADEDAVPEETPAAAERPRPRRAGRPVVKIAEESASGPSAEEAAEGAPAAEERRAVQRRPRRRKGGDEDAKELFAFYEQSLF